MKFDKSLLKNKMVLNVIFVIAVLNVIGYMTMGNFEAVTFFILLGGLTSFFSKNMIIILGIPLIIVNLYAMQYRNREGMKVEGVVEEDKEKEKTTTDTTTTANLTEIAKDVLDKEKPIPDTFEVGRKKGSSKIDYATTVEDAYEDLNKILGGDGIKKLTADTQGLLEQQAQLTKAMSNIGPMMKNMKPMMDSMSSLMQNFKQ